MPNLEEALALALKAHRGQVDKYGQPYILHPLRVMLRLESEAERIVGILHDVVEDSTVTFDDLRQMGYSEELITALDCVTRRGSETYEEFIQRSTDNPIARHVKLADLEDNMDLSRIPGDLTESNLARLNRYRWAWRLLRMADALL